MVYYFTSNVTSPSAYIYMGKDKDLIAYGFEEDVWPLLEDCAQLTKANSIEGEDERLKATREWD
ncbi:unnamed protein product [Aureobasidium mustum]|uniref:Uncharacterized protein n=1 Tax=Aureobasidium mustum TaxID=2773714 RepID=A0A9N8PGA7_9PEZI|nr:unnamed protein product [Aureobasidium mustum]